MVVITPPGTVMSQASVHLDWNSEVLRTPLEELSPPNPPQPASRPYTSTSRTQYMTDADDVVDNDIYGTYDKYKRGSTSHSTHVNGTGDLFASQQYSRPPSGGHTPAHTPAHAKCSPPATFQSTKSNPPSPPACKTPEPVFVTEGNRLFESSTRTPNLPKGFPYPEPESRTGPKQPSFSNISMTSSSSSSGNILQPPSIPPAATSTAYELAETPPAVPKPALDPSVLAVKPALPMTPQDPPQKPALSSSLPTTSSVPKAAVGPVSQATNLKTNQDSINSQPAYFRILAERLQARREALRQPRVPRTDIANELAKHKSAYAQAGVANFAAFINLAHAAGVVEAGGSGNNQWVSLRPGWPAAATSS